MMLPPYDDVETDCESFLRKIHPFHPDYQLENDPG
jgi:hypothetical protein